MEPVFYAEMNFCDKFNLLVGSRAGEIVFSHYFNSGISRRKLIEIESTFFPDMVEEKAVLLPIFEKIIQFRNGQPGIDPADQPVSFSRGSSFEIKIWSTLRQVKKGTVVSYSRLAEQAGFPGSQRAVGNAMSKNFLLLFVPCHRVINKNQSLGGFSCGIEAKKTLLNIEVPKLPALTESPLKETEQCQ